MVDVRRRFELYVALTRILKPDLAAYLIEHLAEVEREPDFQRHNRERFEANPAAIYNLYAELRSRLGRVHTTTLFEMLDPLEWANVATEPEGATVAAAVGGGEDGNR